MSDRTWRAGIVGAGVIGAMHAQAMADLDGVELVGAVARDRARVDAFAARFGCAAYTDAARMLDAEQLDFVTVATPSGAHLEVSLAAIERGVAVLCEKPLEIGLERCDRMIDAAAARGVPLGGIFPQRFNPVVRAVHDAAARGRFGDLASVSAHVPWWRDDAYYGPGRWQGTQALDGGGALINQSIHGVDALLWIAGAAAGHGAGAENPVEEVFAYAARRGHDADRLEVEDTCVVVLRLRGGGLGQILAATSMYPGTFKRLQVGGRDGTAEVLEEQLTTWAFREPLAGDTALAERFGAATTHGGGASDPTAIDYGLHAANIDAFVTALGAGREPPISGVEARKAVAVVSAAYESARRREPVRVR